MKKMSSVLFAAVLLGAVMSGCGGSPANTGGSAEAAIPGGTGSAPKIGVAIYKFSDTFMAGVRKSVVAAAKGIAAVDIVDSKTPSLRKMTRLTFSLPRDIKAC